MACNIFPSQPIRGPHLCARNPTNHRWEPYFQIPVSVFSSDTIPEYSSFQLCSFLTFLKQAKWCQRGMGPKWGFSSSIILTATRISSFAIFVSFMLQSPLRHVARFEGAYPISKSFKTCLVIKIFTKYFLQPVFGDVLNDSRFFNTLVF